MIYQNKKGWRPSAKTKMKTKNIILTTAILLLLTAVNSCTIDPGNLPNISFKTGGKYITSNTTIKQGDTVLIGINASKAEDVDVLKKFDISRSYDGALESSVYNTDLIGLSGDQYAYDYYAIARKQAGTEKYTFTVINRDGLKNSVSLQLTVQ